MSNLEYRSLLAICVLCLSNFVGFFIVALVIGGDAVNGKAVGGHFYLANHGRLTEVSEGVYTYSLWHVRSLFITHPVAMLTGYFAEKERKARKSRRLPDGNQIRTSS
jgi:hypothetical protein